MTYRQYIKRWKKKCPYRQAVRECALSIKSDGCSGPALEFYQDGCFEHDIHFAYHYDFFTGEQITEEDADLMLKWYIQYHSWFGRWSPMAAWRYEALSSEGGWGFGHDAWITGPRRLQERLGHSP